MARSTATREIPTTAAGPIPPYHGPREANPRRRGRKGRKRGKSKRKNPPRKKNLGYGAKVGIAIASVAVVGGGSFLLYRHFSKPKPDYAILNIDPSVMSQLYFDPPVT